MWSCQKKIGLFILFMNWPESNFAANKFFLPFFHEQMMRVKGRTYKAWTGDRGWGERRGGEGGWGLWGKQQYHHSYSLTKSLAPSTIRLQSVAADAVAVKWPSSVAADLTAGALRAAFIHIWTQSTTTYLQTEVMNAISAISLEHNAKTPPRTREVHFRNSLKLAIKPDH